MTVLMDVFSFRQEEEISRRKYQYCIIIHFYFLKKHISMSLGEAIPQDSDKKPKLGVRKDNAP